jgi:hypothetical protein
MYTKPSSMYTRLLSALEQVSDPLGATVTCSEPSGEVSVAPACSRFSWKTSVFALTSAMVALKFASHSSGVGIDVTRASIECAAILRSVSHDVPACGTGSFIPAAAYGGDTVHSVPAEWDVIGKLTEFMEGP